MKIIDSIRNWFGRRRLRRLQRELDRHEKKFQKRDWARDLKRSSTRSPDLRVKVLRRPRVGDIIREPSGARYLVTRSGWRRLRSDSGHEVDDG